MLAAMPLVAAALRVATTRAIWLWGDQALIDIEARNSLLGRNLLGVYDRYGWHHLGPMWLSVLGVFRWLGGGSSLSLVLGSYVVQASAAAGIVVVAGRLRPGLTAWWVALVLLGYEWTFGLERLGTVWAPYAIALPTALFVLLVADAVSSRNPWAPTIGAVVCATFLVQTDISTAVLVTVLVLAAPLLRLAAHVVRPQAERDGSSSGRWSVEPGWGWSSGNWRLGAVALVAVTLVLWLPPAVQQLSVRPGNLTSVYRFLVAHPAYQAWRTSLKVEGTVFGSFPFRLGEQAAKRDAKPTWLVAGPPWEHLWYLAYLLVTLVAAIWAWVRRQRPAFSLAAASFTAMLAAGLSVHLVYGPLYPYLVIWTGALVVPAWAAWWLAVAPSAPSPSGGRADALVRLALTRGRARLVVPLASVATAVAVTCAFVLAPVPMSGVPSLLAERSWKAVSVAALAPGVKTIYIDIASSEAMPEAAAIADQAMRHGLRVELNPEALYFADPSFTRRSAPQLSVAVCCGPSDPGRPPAGMRFRRRVGGQDIFTSSELGK